MTVKRFGEDKAKGFNNHVQSPETETQGLKWQESNKSWWEKNPMRYDETEGITYEEFSKEFFEEIDSRFLHSAWQFLPWEKIPFDALIDFNSLGGKDVLEIGVGCGSHAKLLSQHSRSYTGIDITDYAVNCTEKRLQCDNLKGTILKMDAEKMQFSDSSFDFVWSWGVIHHASNTRKILEEIYRVLKNKSEAIIMVYHRSTWNTYIRGGLYYGIIMGELFKSKKLSRIIQDHTDGALARYYSIPEWKNLVSDLFHIENIAVYGSKSQIIPLPWGRTKEILMSLIPDGLGRFITNRPSMGFLLVSKLRKK